MGAAWGYSRTSLGARIMGLAKETKLAKLSSEIFAWTLFNLTFIAGWLVTKISLIDLFSAEGIEGLTEFFMHYSLPNLEFSMTHFLQ